MRLSVAIKILTTGVLGIALLLPATAPANTMDWLQVKRFKEVLEQAEAGKVQAMYEVGRKYERGRGTELNMQKAAEWYQRAVEANHAPSMARLGILYVEGNGVKRDLNRAVKLLTRAAQEDIPSAQYQLASLYELGIGVDEDLQQAVNWYRKAYEGGYYRAGDKATKLSAQLNAQSAPAPEPEPTTASTPAPKPAPKPAKRASSNLRTIAAILNGNWQRRNRPAGYLPSAISQCSGQNQGIHCISTAQERSTGSETITYNTEASLSDFNGTEFRISYSNNILNVEKNNDATASGFDEEESSTTGRSRLAGARESAHQLECTLENPNLIRCTKDKLLKLEFSSQ